MLVLARQRNQSIVIGDEIEVTVVDVRGDKVRLGINAPRTVSVHRKEIYLGIQKDKAATESAHPVELALPPADAAQFMQEAIEEAKRGLAENGLPIGSVLVRDGQIIARGHNRRVQQSDPMAHAEIDCLRQAGRQSSYKDTVLYSTLMPCYLCSGAVIQFGIPKVVAGESVNFPGAPDLLRRHGVQVIDLHDPQCIQLMGDFIKAHPQLWHEDIGK